MSTQPSVAQASAWPLIATIEAAGVWSLRSGIFPENTASLALHQRPGFRRQSWMPAWAAR
jgi:L-amino acid N-acyltransferase YncA